MSARRVRTAILISGRGSNMMALVEAARAPGFPAQIALVLSNRPEAAGLAFAKAQGIAAAAVDHRIFAGRDAFEAGMQAVLDIHRIELICLAGFMRLLTPGFVARWQGRLLNIHPALLPAFKGLDTHARALAAGVDEHGCTVHHVAAGMDEGAPVMQARVPVLPGDTPQTLAARVLAQEHLLYPKALALAAGALRQWPAAKLPLRLPRDGV